MPQASIDFRSNSHMPRKANDPSWFSHFRNLSHDEATITHRQPSLTRSKDVSAPDRVTTLDILHLLRLFERLQTLDFHRPDTDIRHTARTGPGTNADTNVRLGSIFARKSAWQPPWPAAASARSGQYREGGDVK
jgi:hypothetical protein